MSKFFLIFFTLPVLLFGAGVSQKNKGVSYSCDPIWYSKDFTGQDLTKKVIANGTVIFGSCFSRESPGGIAFPPGMTGVTLVRCNLDNVFIPPGNTVVDCSQKTFIAQNDLCDWIVDGSNKPVEPVEKELYIKLSISTDPLQIPAQKMKQNIISKTMDDLENAKAAAVEAPK